ncbi:C2H2 type zinc finger domain protein [Aulographum hederae CBS 113979]|uniref:C2H2 type zinc finger domain protein n=1 Tax=Aulographum hederae CBS 113979 TaxID=1176131 RepID=A0A6G1GWJ6_9PEZI|nr:C2H2 type zinc finger domain protein [Aulographum hederae CBS 113979]
MSTEPQQGLGEPRRLECRECKKVFAKAEHLIRHERSHTGLKPYRCKTCGRSFTRQDSLARHEKLHIRESGITSHLGFADPAQTAISAGEGSAYGHDQRRSSSATPFSDSSLNVHPQYGTGNPYVNYQDPMNVNSQLIWPDTENLFHVISSSDPSNPFPAGFFNYPTYPGINDGTTYPNQSYENPQGLVATPTTEIQTTPPAVREVSDIVARNYSRVTKDIDLRSITSVFLDECLHMFFTRFIPTFPVMHRATFIFRDSAQPLLLNAIAVGSLYLGQKDAVRKGESLCSLAYTAVVTSWHQLIKHKGPYDSRSGIQLVLGALLGQTYAIVSERSLFQQVSRSAHGLGFYWARDSGMFDLEPFSLADLPAIDAPEAEKLDVWRKWASREIQIRAILGHYITDGQIAAASGNPTCVRHVANKLTLPADDGVFAADNVDDWITQMTSQRDETLRFCDIYRLLLTDLGAVGITATLLSPLAIQVILEGLQGLILECDESGGFVVGVPIMNDIRSALLRTYRIIIESSTLNTIESMETRVRWHTICLDSCAHVTQLCNHLCLRSNTSQTVLGGNKPKNSTLDLPSWASSRDARKALLHAAAIQDIMEQIPPVRGYAIHLPMSLFKAVIIYLSYSIGAGSTVPLPRTIDWSDVLGRPSNPREERFSDDLESLAPSSTEGFVKGTLRQDPTRFVSRNLLYELNSMQNLMGCLASQWGIAHEMGEITGRWLEQCR